MAKYAKKSSRLISAAIVSAGLFISSTQAADKFEIVRAISDGSPYPSTSEGAAGRRGDTVVKEEPIKEPDKQSDAWLERQLRITDGVTG
jgi:hypothetical protein